MHYLDHASTSKMLPEAVEAALAVMRAAPRNPSSVHRLGIEAERIVEDARRDIARALGCERDELFFTSGGTEANNWAILSGADGLPGRGGLALTSALEHHSSLEPVKALSRRGFDVRVLPPDKNGDITPALVLDAFENGPCLMSFMLINNETGQLSDISGIADAVKRREGVFFHCDAVQAFMKHDFSARELGVSTLSVSAHKIGGPAGIGALYVKKGAKLPPVFLGGGQQKGMRPGTEPVALISAFATAVNLRRAALAEDIARMNALRDHAMKLILSAVPGAHINGRPDAPHILNFSVRSAPSEVLIRMLQDSGVYVSAGSACSRGRRSHVLAALGIEPALCDGALRVSLSPESTEADIEALCGALSKALLSLGTGR